MSKAIKVVDYDEITTAIEDNNHPHRIWNVFAQLIDEFEKQIYQNEDVRAVQKMMHSTNIESITWGAFEAKDYIGQHAWSFPVVMLKSGEEFEVGESGVSEELRNKIVCESEQDLIYIVDFLNNDVLANINCFSDEAYVEIRGHNANVNIGAIYNNTYSQHFLLWIGDLMVGHAR